MKNWKECLRENFTDLDKLASFLELTLEQKKALYFHPSFRLNLPKRLANKIEKGTLDDPIFRQFVPTQSEKVSSPLYSLDPVKDAQFHRSSKLLQKYTGRALLICTSACAMHCRYCFRQNFDYPSEPKGYAKELSLIQEDASIKEIILSGGDPLSLPDSILGPLVQAIDAIPHIRRIRFHTRFLIGIPERIDEEFLSWAENIQNQVYVVLHINHPKEWDETLRLQIKPLQKLGWLFLNQSVLLKGINDSLNILSELNEQLINAGVIPYYLHQLDRVKGSEHFEVDTQEGIKLIHELLALFPGYGVPKFVQEIPGEQNKTPLIY